MIVGPMLACLLGVNICLSVFSARSFQTVLISIKCTLPLLPLPSSLVRYINSVCKSLIFTFGPSLLSPFYSKPVVAWWLPSVGLKVLTIQPSHRFNLPNKSQRSLLFPTLLSNFGWSILFLLFPSVYKSLFFFLKVSSS